MRLLLDTHALLWWLGDDSRLGRPSRDLIEEPANEILVSVASLWEIVIKVCIGKLRADIGRIENAILQDGFIRVAIGRTHLSVLSTLPMFHRDPFDHMLIAQSIAEGATFMSDDQQMLRYPVRVVGCSPGQ